MRRGSGQVFGRRFEFSWGLGFDVGFVEDELAEREVTREGYPWWLWPNLLSLDAPAVAVAWQILFAKVMRGHLPGMMPVFLAGAVWLLYVADRLMDVRRMGAGEAVKTARHAFYRDHGRAMKVAWVVVFVVLAALVPFFLPMGLIVRAVFLLGFVWLYFEFVARAARGTVVPYAKEIFAGLIFAMGTTMAVGFYVGMGSNPDLLSGDGLVREWILQVMDLSAFGGAFLAFAYVCAFNCALINTWEGEVAGWKGSRWLWYFLAAAGVVVAVWSVATGSRFAVVYVCAGLGALGLGVLCALEERLSIEARRVWADVVLLTPLVGVWFVE
ncbi:MAG: hypothetical protein AAF591_05600 [Verrucomicrobiota bacterium]